MMLAADAVIVDAACGNDAWYVLGLLHGQHRQAVMIDRDATREAARRDRERDPPVRAAARGRDRFAAIDAHVRAHLERRGIIAESDLPRLDLGELASDVARPRCTGSCASSRAAGAIRTRRSLGLLVRRGIFI